MSPNQAIPEKNQMADTFIVPDLPFSQAQRNEIFSETSSRVYRELCGPEGVVLQQNNFLQQVLQEVHSNPPIGVTIAEHEDSIGQMIQEIYRLREEIAKVNLALRQGFVLTDETCTKHANVLEDLQSFAGSQVGTNQKVQEMMTRLSGQLSFVHQRTRELQKDTSLDWKIQEREHDLMKLQESTKNSIQNDQTLTKLATEVQKLQQSLKCKRLRQNCDN